MSAKKFITLTLSDEQGNSVAHCIELETFQRAAFKSLAAAGRYFVQVGSAQDAGEPIYFAQSELVQSLEHVAKQASEANSSVCESLVRQAKHIGDLERKLEALSKGLSDVGGTVNAMRGRRWDTRDTEPCPPPSGQDLDAAFPAADPGKRDARKAASRHF
jgi:hypothetical protein